MTTKESEKKHIATEVRNIKKLPGFEKVAEEEIVDYYFRFREISEGNVYIDIFQFQELLNNFGVSAFKTNFAVLYMKYWLVPMLQILFSLILTSMDNLAIHLIGHRDLIELLLRANFSPVLWISQQIYICIIHITYQNDRRFTNLTFNLKFNIGYLEYGNPSIIS